MTDKLAAAVREFIVKYVNDENEPTLLPDLTALISEHYVAKEEVDKMVSERLREELIAYDKWATRHLNGSGKIFTAEGAVDEYLESR